MKVLILGSKGMLGDDLVSTFFDTHEVTAWSRNDLDIVDVKEVTNKITQIAPDIIINASAYTDVDGAETNEDQAIKVNGEAVGTLADVAKELGATLVHFSTDYVFNGSKKEGYVEGDTTDPINAYGRSKRKGELRILNSELQNYYIIRSSWLYGHHGKNFVDTMLSLAEKGEPLKVVDDQTGSPTSTIDLAEATLDIITTKQPAGIYHRTNSGSTSWYGFAKEIFAVYGKDVDLSACATEDFPRPAQRPAYSILQSTKLPEMRDWKEALKEYHTESS